MSKRCQILDYQPSIPNKNGFTLIELIVVFTVIAVLSAIGVVSFVNYTHAQNLNQSANDLLNSLNTAKALSTSQLKSLTKNGQLQECQSYETLNGYGIKINTAQHAYSLYMVCSANGTLPTNLDSSSNLWKITLADDIAFDTSKNNITNVFFPVLSGAVVTNGSGNADTIALTSYGMEKIIKITQGYLKLQ